MIRKVHDIGIEKETDNYNDTMIAARCLPILALVSMNDDEEAFEVFADDMPHDNDKTR